jgi:F0F1-type ATP synthase epsilon subunit
MASNQYLILDLSSPSKHETIQIQSISINSKEGDIQILPTHEPWQGIHKEQEITIILNDINHNSRSIYISEAISTLTLDDNQRSKLTIVCKEYSTKPLSSSNELDDKSKLIISQAQTLAKVSLIPTLTPNDLELREIETTIRREFEDDLK